MLHIKNGLYLIFALLLLQIKLGAQSDSTVLLPDRLGIKDIHITKEEVVENKIYTASRSLNDIEELPYSVWVITGEEILERGLFTLGDVLKQAPGIFVSQPGSALFGETFIMSGLFGNTHTKIMIDNVPVKPYNAAGTPIAHQLPVRQAERIEIIYGPSALSNEAGAGAGTINIVTRKSDRPVYVYSDLTSGTQGGNSMNVLFGGKLGKRKNTLDFNAYGTATFLTNLNISTISPFFDPTEYPLNSFSVLPDTSTFIPQELPLTSRQFGINLKFRSFNLTIANMQRSSHSALGSSPAALNYLVPTTTYGESINVVNFAYQKNLKKVGFGFQFTYNRLIVNKDSSYEYIFPFAKQQVDRIIDETTNGDSFLRDSLIARSDAALFNGRRFAGGSSTDFNFSGSVSFFPIKNVELLLSPNLSYNVADEYTFYNPRPVLASISRGVRLNLNANLIARAYIKFEKLNIIIGVNNFSNLPFQQNIDPEISTGKLLPQFAGLYKINSKLSIKANYSNSFLIPSSYIRDQGGRIQLNAPSPIISINNEFRQNPQETKYGELALRWKFNKMIKMDVALFAAENSRLLNFTTKENEDGFFYGYDNSDGRNSRISGIRFSIGAKNIIEQIRLNINANYNFNRGEQELPSGETLNALLSQPKHIAQLNVSLKAFKKISISIDNVFVGSYSSSNLQSISDFNEEAGTLFERNASWTMHIATTLHLNDNFNIFLKGNNISSNDFLPGIDALGGPDDLFLNTQREANWILGVSYNLD